MSMPTSESLLDKMNGFEFEALEKRDLIVKELFVKLNVSDQCQDMIALLESQTEIARQSQTRVGEVWLGNTTLSVEEIEVEKTAHKQREEAEKRIDKMAAELARNGVETVKVDIAIGPKAEILVAYGTEGNANNDPKIQEKLANLLNDCLFAECVLVTQDSTIYQAKTLDRLIQDRQGQLVPGERDQIEKAFGKMKESLASKGIQLALKDDYKYQEVKQAATTAAVSKTERVPEEKPHVQPGEAPSKPEI